MISKGAKDTAEKWIDFMLTAEVSGGLSERTGFGNTVTADRQRRRQRQAGLAGVRRGRPERSDLWNEVKATP